MSGIFIEDEAVWDEFAVSMSQQEYHLTVTNRRCLFWNSNKTLITDFQREALSSIDYKLERVWIIGVILIVLGSVLAYYLPSIRMDKILQNLCLFVGLGIVGTGIALLYNQEDLKFWIAGRAEALKISKGMYVWDKRPKPLYQVFVKVRALKGLKKP